MFWSFAYLALRRVLQLLVLVLRGDRSKEIEILVLRHQVSVLRRPKYSDPTSHHQTGCCSPRYHD